MYHRCTDCSQESDITFDLCPTCLEKSGSSCPRDLAHWVRAVTPDVFKVTIETPPKDLKTYVRSFIESQMPVELSENDLSFFDRLSSSLGWECYHHKTLVDKIIDAIAKCSQGKLLLAKLYTNSLNCQPSLRDVKDAVTEMQEQRRDLSDTMDDLYENDMNEQIMGPRASQQEICTPGSICYLLCSTESQVRGTSTCSVYACWRYLALSQGRSAPRTSCR
jgi:hypothetical protein